MQIYNQHQMQQFQTKTASLKHIDALTDFQVNMAMETENFKLDRQLVSSALKYFLEKAESEQHNRYGIILIRLAGEQALGSQMITFENDHHWWFQSVYISQHARRQGHFTALFSQAVRLGKEKGVKNIKLYVQNNNQRAKSTYFKLGMKPIQDKIYSYDFVYGGYTFSHQKFAYSIKFVSQKSEQAFQWVKTKQNILTGIKYEQNDWNFTFVIEKQGKIVGVSKIFYEFSDWRFGLMWYVREIYLAEEQKSNYQSVLKELIGKIIEVSELKVAVIRVIYRLSQNLTFKGGHQEHYDILQIDL